MDLLPSDDQVEIVNTVDKFLANELSISVLRERVLDAGAPIGPDAWGSAGELGMFSLALDEAAGGAGYSLVEEALVCRQLGRHLAPLGFVASMLAAHVAAGAGLEAERDAIAAGQAPVALGVAAGDRALEEPLRGAFELFDLAPATFVLLCDTDGRTALLCTEDLPAGEPVACLDPLTELVVVELDGARTVAATGAEDVVARLGPLYTAAVLVGVAEATRDASVRYAKEREQFGKPIGVFQAIKHPCADMATRCEAAASQVSFAALAVADGRGDAGFQVAAAKRIAAQAAYENVRANVQIHGGLGYTWEHDAHLYVSRTHLADRLFGGVRLQQAALLAAEPRMP